MTLSIGAGPRADSIQIDVASRGGVNGWSNVRPLQREGTAAVGQFLDLLAAISHEMRTPLNAVIGFSDAMEQEVFGPIGNARYREYVGHIRSSGVEVLKAAEDALMMTAVLAQPRARVLEDLALAPLVAEAVADFGASGEIEIDVAEGLDVRGDRRILPRAVRQLLGIACSRCGPGGRVRVSAGSEHGLVVLVVEVDEVMAGTPSLMLGETPGIMELGLGRRELAMWLATGLLDLMDCRLDVEMNGSGLKLRTTLEQCCEGLFGIDEARARG